MQLPPGMMPPGGGGAPPPGGGGAPPMGGMIAQVLQRLMSNPQAIQGILGQLAQNPAAMAGMQNFMRGQSPTAGMPLPPSRGGPVPPGVGGGGPPMQPPGGGGPPMPPPGPSANAGPPLPQGGDKAEAMAQSKIDNAGNTWDGTDAPTKNDIERLKEDPTPAAIKSFDQQFGQGMAEKYLGDSEQGEPAEDQGEESQESPEEEKSEYDE
jgi:hypothetical protein